MGASMPIRAVELVCSGNTIMKTSYFNSLNKFQQDEDGLTPLQIVMIFAVGIILLVLMTTIGKDALTAWRDSIIGSGENSMLF